MSDPIDSAPCQEKEAYSAQEHGGGTVDVEKTNSRAESPRGEEDGDHGSHDSEDASRERWNESRIKMFRFGVALFGFIIMGMNDAVLGVSRDPMGPRGMLSWGYTASILTAYHRRSFPMSVISLLPVTSCLGPTLFSSPETRLARHHTDTPV